MTDALAVRQEENKALLARVIETKMTRGELLDMVIDRVAQELSTELDRLKSERNEIRTELTLANAVALSKKATGTVEIVLNDRHRWLNGERRLKYYKLEVSFDLPADVELPKRYTEARIKADALDEKIGDVVIKKQRLSAGRTRARSEMVRHALESTPEGTRILEAIDAFKETIAERLTAPTP